MRPDSDRSNVDHSRIVNELAPRNRICCMRSGLVVMGAVHQRACPPYVPSSTAARCHAALNICASEARRTGWNSYSDAVQYRGSRNGTDRRSFRPRTGDLESHRQAADRIRRYRGWAVASTVAARRRECKATKSPTFPASCTHHPVRPSAPLPYQRRFGTPRAISACRWRHSSARTGLKDNHVAAECCAFPTGGYFLSDPVRQITVFARRTDWLASHFK